jgi:hypothetical protein
LARGTAGVRVDRETQDWGSKGSAECDECVGVPLAAARAAVAWSASSKVCAASCALRRRPPAAAEELESTQPDPHHSVAPPR